VTTLPWRGLGLVASLGQPLSGSGLASLRIDGRDGGLLATRFPSPLDFSGYDELSFGLRTNSSQQMLSLTFLTDNGNGYMAKLDVGSSLPTQFKIALTSLESVGIPRGWNHLEGLMIKVIASKTKPFFTELTDIEFSVSPTVVIATLGGVGKQSYVDSNVTMPKLLPARMISMTQLSPTSYRLEIESTGPFVLVLAQAFHPLWKVFFGLADDFVGGFAGQILSEANHFRINSYANGWLVQRNGRLVLSIVYVHQPIFYATVVVSAATILCILVAFVYFWVFKGREPRAFDEIREEAYLTLTHEGFAR